MLERIEGYHSSVRKECLEGTTLRRGGLRFRIEVLSQALTFMSEFSGSQEINGKVSLNGGSQAKHPNSAVIRPKPEELI